MTPPVPERPALFLDFDGTLVDIADRPDGIAVPATLPALLQRVVAATDGAAAVISGRRIEQIDHYLGTELAAAGLHGLERRAAPGSAVEMRPPPSEVAVLRERIAVSGLLADGVMLEDKGAGLAVHYRAAPERGVAVIATMTRLVEDLPALDLIRGKMVVEAKGRGFNKGDAVRRFMNDAPFAGRTPVFIGDDVTDEDGITAAEALGGFGIKVGDAPSQARYRVEDVPGVHAWLAAVAGGAP